MRKFISPVLIKWIKVALLLLVFVVLLHSGREGKNIGAVSKVHFGVIDTVGISGSEALQVDESVETETVVSYSYVLPAIAIGRVRLRF